MLSRVFDCHPEPEEDSRNDAERAREDEKQRALRIPFRSEHEGEDEFIVSGGMTTVWDPYDMSEVVKTGVIERRRPRAPRRSRLA